MNDYQKQLVQNSFRQVVPIADQAAALFYDRLFILDPSLRTLFKADMAQQGFTDMAQQGLKLMNTLQLAVNGLDDLERILPALQSLGRNHVKYGVQHTHYATVGDALIWTLEQGLGVAFTDEVREAWLEAYNLLSGVMQKAAYSYSSV